MVTEKGLSTTEPLELVISETPEQQALRELRGKYFGEAITNLITRRTPREEIRYRPGRGQLQFRYLPVAWFIDQLNSLFSFNWSFEILEQGIVKDKHIWVKGRLTVGFLRDGERVEIVKTQYGGSEVKLTTQGAIIDYADDLKSAASDCLKKCASLLGLAWDVYSGDREAKTEAAPQMKQMLAFYKRAQDAGMTQAQADDWFLRQGDINPEGKSVQDVTEADLLGAFPKFRDMIKAKEK